MINDVYINTFLFTFPTLQEEKCVITNSLWNFKGFCIILNQGLLGPSIQEVPLNYSTFLMKKNAMNIGKVLGNFIVVDCCILKIWPTLL